MGRDQNLCESSVIVISHFTTFWTREISEWQFLLFLFILIEKIAKCFVISHEMARIKRIGWEPRFDNLELKWKLKSDSVKCQALLLRVNLNWLTHHWYSWTLNSSLSNNYIIENFEKTLGCKCILSIQFKAQECLNIFNSLQIYIHFRTDNMIMNILIQKV